MVYTGICYLLVTPVTGSDHVTLHHCLSVRYDNVLYTINLSK